LVAGALGFSADWIHALMARFSPALNSFNAGEWSPLMRGRVDLAKYPMSVRAMENCMPAVQGPAMKRPGTVFAGTVKDEGVPVTLIPWEFSEDESFVLEFGENYVRFWTGGGQVESAPSVPLEVATPYTAAQARNIQVAQLADVMYLVHRDVAPQVLRRFSTTSWTLTPFEPERPPLSPDNLDTSITVTASGFLGAHTLTASSPIFSPDDVGSSFAFRSIVESEYDQWKSGTSYSIGDVVWSDSLEKEGAVNAYRATTAGTSGTRAPGHSIGTESDGGVTWQFAHDDRGYCTITSYTSDTQVDIQTDSYNALPLSATTGSFRWAFGAWSDRQGYPRCIAFFEQRLFFAGTEKQPQTIWGSEIDNFISFNPGSLLDTDSVSYTLASDRVNQITFLSPGRALTVGTEGAEFAARSGLSDEPITPTNIRITRESRYGSQLDQPASTSNVVLFVQRNGANLRELSFNFDVDGFQANDISLVSEHITSRGLERLALQQEPDSTLWTWTKDDGTLVGLTYEREQEVVGWHQHDISGAVESIAVIPNAGTLGDRVWMTVRRTIDGQTRRYMEYLSDRESAVWSDSTLAYSGAPVSTISGLDHLEGETVSVVADGAVHPERVVTSGEIELTAAYESVVVGLPYEMTMETQRIEGGSQNGTSQGKNKRIHRLIARLNKTGPGLHIGTTVENVTEVHFRKTTDLMDNPVPLFTGDTSALKLPGGNLDEGIVVIQHRLPQPCTVVALYPQMEIHDAR
jgi:hypothetical protein